MARTVKDRKTTPGKAPTGKTTTKAAANNKLTKDKR
jgi:hypothetical protein